MSILMLSVFRNLSDRLPRGVERLASEFRKHQSLAGLITMCAIIASTQMSCDDTPDTTEAKVVNTVEADPTDGWGETVVNPGQSATLPDSAGPGDWPGFRGADRDSHAPGVTFATDWETNPPQELWRRRVGEGWSSFAAIGDYAFTQEQRGPKEVVVCYDANTGDEIWINHLVERFTETGRSGPRATPTFSNGKLYTQSAMGTLQCLDAATGDVIWKRNIAEDAGADVPQYGFASSPLLISDMVIVFAGGPDGNGVAAYRADDGELVWTAGAGTHGYTSGHRANLADTDQVIFSSNFGTESFRPTDGEVLWKMVWATKVNPRCVQPVLIGNDSLIIGSAGGVGTRRLTVSNVANVWTAEEDWQTVDYEPFTSDAVLHNGFNYGFDNRALMCIDVATGEIRWKGKPHAGQLLLIPEMELLLNLTDDGMVRIVEANPEAEVELATFKAISGKTLNHPVIANGKLFVRNSEEAACFALPQFMN
jgi:outer membrane protein assembly factor BamB